MGTMSMPSVATGLSPAATAALHGGPKAGLAASTLATRTRAAAEDFESVFVHTMLQQMFSNVGKGPFSGGPGAQVWQSFLTDEYSKSFVKNGGFGIADHVQRALMAQQEVR